jgi:hypothetical protein
LHEIEYLATGAVLGYESERKSVASERESLRASNEALLQSLQQEIRLQKPFSPAEEVDLARAVLKGASQLAPPDSDSMILCC